MASNSGAEILPDGPFDARTHALLLETLILDEWHRVFGRGGIVDKPAHDLHAHEYGAEIFTVAKVQAGRTLTQDILPGGGGVDGTRTVWR
jgi:hypothetical protein